MRSHSIAGRGRWRFIFLALLFHGPLAVLDASQAAAEDRRYGVQLGSFEEGQRSNAESFDASLPTSLRRGTHLLLAHGRWRVLVGSWAGYPDALLVRDHIRTTIPNCKEAFIFAFNAAGNEPHPDMLDILPPLFTERGAESSNLAIQSLEGDPAYESLRQLDQAGDGEVYEAALKSKAPSVPPDQPVAGYIALNLGIQRIKAGEFEKALSHLLPVAEGDIASAAIHRVMAIRRVAWVWHHQGDRLAAYRAYRELERFSSSELVRATCATECVGLLMELAESGGKGTHADVRREIDRYLSSVPEDLVRQRALLHLMEHETWARQPKRDLLKAARLGEELVARYSGLPQAPMRELATASWQTAMYYRLAGDKEKALEWTYRTLRDYPEDVETFANSHPHAKARFGLTEMVMLTGTPEEYNSILRELIREYPQDRTVQRMADLYPYLRN